MSQELVLTAVGPDRPGIAAELSGIIHAARGNLADSRMVNLRGKFALVALVEGDAEILAAVRARLRDAAASMRLSIEFGELGEVREAGQTGAARDRPREGVPFRLKTYSMDQPGIVHRMTKHLSELGINIEELETNLESAPFMGSPVFTMEILMLVPRSVGVTKLRRDLEQLGETLNCDVDLDPA
jgi:glycine cleavage system transcriptional repressor